MAAGFAGILDYPTVAVIDGRMRQDLEHGGMGLAKEVAPIEQAALLDLLTTAYVCTVEEAEAMVRAGVHVIIAHLGLTVGVSVGGHHAMAIDPAADPDAPEGLVSDAVRDPAARDLVVVMALDTQGDEAALVCDAIRSAGLAPFVIEVGVLRDPPFVPDVAGADVAAEGGVSIHRLRADGDRYRAVEAMRRGAERIVTGLFDEGRACPRS